MGVHNFMEVLRGTPDSINTTLHDVINESDEEVWIGIDMSILMVTTIKSSPKQIDQLFVRPPCPIDGFNEKICKQIQQLYDNGAFLVCVFDGLPGKLKTDCAHLTRYGRNDALKEKLQQLYEVTSFASAQEERNNMTEIAKVRKNLAAINRPDLFHSLKMELEHRFGNRMMCIGSAFEADHQLAALVRQNVIDYVWTNDSDLSFLGCDVILNLKPNGRCFVSRTQFILKQLLPQKYKDNNPWTLDILHHAACFLGCDFIERNPGNTVRQLGTFKKQITTSDGTLKEDNEIYSYISSNALNPKGVNCNEKAKWTDEKKASHIKLWKHTVGMFSNGPAFVIKIIGDTCIRDAMKNTSFEIDLGSYSTGSNDWLLDNGETLIGFDPISDLKDAFAMRDELKNNVHDDVVYKSLFKRAFCFEIWTKTAADIIPLPDILDDHGNTLFHGSILDFNIIPIRCHSKEQLQFWLSCRQIKSPPSLQEIKSLVKFVWDKLDTKLKPIHKQLMRGRSGWVAPELLRPKNDCQEVSNKSGEDALLIIREIFPNINDQMFSCMFGKRNGTRQRIFMHLNGGSFNINSLRVTEDLASDVNSDMNLVVFSIKCTPSMKLKEGSREKYYDLTLVVELNDDRTFKQFHLHPLSRCGCPNGCIICAHMGAFLLLLLLLKNFDEGTTNSTTFEKIHELLPVPVNDILVLPMLASYCFPLNDSEKKISQNNYIKSPRMSNIIENLLENNEDEDSRNNMVSSTVSDLERTARDNGIELGNEHDELVEYALEGIIDATDTPTLLLIEKLYEWLLDVKNGRDSSGAEIKTVTDIELATTDEARYRDSDEYRAVMIAKQEAFLALTREYTFCGDNSDYDQDTQKYCTFLSQKQPVNIAVIEATSRLRNKDKESLCRKGLMDNIRLDQLARDNNKQS